MAKRTRFHKYSRRASSNKRRSKAWIVIIACVSFLALSVALSLAVGLALGKRAESYEETAEKLDISVKEHYSGGKKVRNVNAVAYQWGYGTGYYTAMGITDFSVCLRDGDGFITYNSKVDVAIGGELDKGSRELSVAVGDIRESGGTVCGYIYSDAFEEEDKYLREIKKAYVLALVDEAAEGGVSDILLVGIDVRSCDLDELEDFLCEASRAADKATLGILLEKDAVVKGDADGTVKRLAACCDFLALDLRKMSKYADSPESAGGESELYATLDALKYYVKVYSMRVVLSTDNERLRESALELGVTGIQVIE